MRILAIHSNEALLQEGYPNFYGYLASLRGREKEFAQLNAEYEKKKHEGPLLLKDVCQVAVFGSDINTVIEDAAHFWEKNKQENIEATLQAITRSFDETHVFTSYPSALYAPLVEEGLVDAIHGLDFVTEGTNIVSIEEVSLRHHQEVQKIMKDINLEKEFTYEPNRYGLLEILIDTMVEKQLSSSDVTVIGNNVTAVPMHAVGKKHFQDLASAMK